MAKVIMICGKVCSGKSTYAEKLRKKENAVLLSADEIMLSIFGQDTGEKHDEYSEKIKSFLLSKTPEFIDIGTSVILDWGFWTSHERNFTRDFFQSCNIKCEIHYIDISDEIRKRCINKRNNIISDGKYNVYFVDDGLMKKCDSIFEVPDENETDVLISV